MLRAVYGNIDDSATKSRFPEHQRFICEGVRVWITHIGGHPARYAPGITKRFKESPVDLFICGHSHILKAGYDKKNQLLHLNPGAAGNHGWHTVRTMMRFEVSQGKVENLEVIEFGR